MRGPKTKLTLQRYSEASNGMGGFTHTWSDVKTIKGVLIAISGNERFSTSKETVYISHCFYCDYFDTAITERDRFLKGNRKFDIELINNVAEMDRNFEIALKEIE